jgi:hypothetical protein
MKVDPKIPYVTIVDDESDIFTREYNGGEREIRGIRDFEGGVQIKAVVLHPHHRDTEVVSRELVYLPDGRIFIFTSSWDTGELRRAKLFANLWMNTDDLLSNSDPELIPVDIAVMGKPAIAAYLRIVHGFYQEDIAEELGVTKKTVQQYLHRFIQPD